MVGSECAGFPAIHREKLDWRGARTLKKQEAVETFKLDTPNRSSSDPANSSQSAHDQVGRAHRSRIAGTSMTNQDSSSFINVKKRKSFDSSDDVLPPPPSPTGTLIQHLILLPPAAAATAAASTGEQFSFKDGEELQLHLEPLNAYLAGDTAAANPVLANSMLLLDICDGSSDGADSNGSSSSTSSTASGTKRSLQASTVVVDRLKKRKLSHRIRSFLLLRPPGLPLVGTDGAADIQHILRAPAWLKNATSELSRESRMMPDEWMWTGADTDHRSWTASSDIERKFSQSCRINANVLPSEQKSMNSQVQMHSVQLSLDEAEKDAAEASLQPILIAQRSRGGSAPPIMVAELESRIPADTESMPEDSPRSPRHSSVPLPHVTPAPLEALKPPAIPQSVLKAQLLAVLRKSLGNKASDAPLRMKKFVVWNAWMRRSKHGGQRRAQGSGSSDEEMADGKASTSAQSASTTRRKLVTSPDADDIEFLDLDEELDEPDDAVGSKSASAEHAPSHVHEAESSQQQQQPPLAVYVAPFSAEQIAAIQAVNRNRPTLKPASEVLQPITSIVTPPTSPPSARPTRPAYNRSSSAGASATAVAAPRYITRRSRSPPSGSSGAGQDTGSSLSPSTSMSKDYFAQVATAKAQRAHSRSKSTSGRSSNSSNSSSIASSSSGSGSDSSSPPGLIHSSSDGSSSDSSTELRTPSPAQPMELHLPSLQNQKNSKDLQSCQLQAERGTSGPPSPKLRPRLYRRATYTA